MQQLVSAVRKGSNSQTEVKGYWEPDYQPGDNCAEVRDAIHAQAQAQAEAQRKPRNHARSQSAQVRSPSSQYHWRDGLPPVCENPSHEHNYACYDKCFGPAPRVHPLDFPVVMNPGSARENGGGNDANFRQLREYVKDLNALLGTLGTRAARTGGGLDGVFAHYATRREQGIALSKTLLEERIKRKRKTHQRNASATSTAVSPVVSPTTVVPDKASNIVDLGRKRGSIDGTIAGSGVEIKLTRRATTAVDAGADKATESKKTDGRPAIPLVWIDAVKDWKKCIEQLAAAHKTELGDTYKRYEHFATPQILEALFANRQSRQQVVGTWLKNFGAFKRMQGQSDVATRWEAQFQNYDRLIQDLAEINELLTAEESGLPIRLETEDITITPRGDTILEFANQGVDWQPTLRFRVSSVMLAETSPIFAQMFTGSTQGLEHVDGIEENLAGELPPAATPFTYPDNTRVQLYKMPQLEHNTEGAMTLLLHAAHMRNDQIPREISFSRFVAVARVAMKYRCTAPLELFVEHRWLPQWMHMAQENMPDGLVTISCAFGLRGLFTRVTKSVIMNVVDEVELRSKNWPQEVKEKIWNVRRAKMAQVYACCAAAVGEYLQPPTASLAIDNGPSASVDDVDGSISPTSSSSFSFSQQLRSPTRSSGTGSSLTLFTPPLPPAPAPPPAFTTKPRCPKGSHWCDASNLGWLMMVLNQLQLLPPVLQAQSFNQSNPASPSRSLGQLVEALASIASPPQPVHPGRGVCDPIPAFRSAINDIYNSVAGITLFDIDGKRHGWGLSRHRRFEPQVLLRAGPALDWDDGNGDMYTPSESEETVAAEVTGRPTSDALSQETICLGIFENLESFDDLHNLALVNWQLYETYKTHELSLMRSIVKADRRKTMMALLGNTATPEKPPNSPSIDKILTTIGKKVMMESLNKNKAPETSGQGDSDDERERDDGGASCSETESLDQSQASLDSISTPDTSSNGSIDHGARQEEPTPRPPEILTQPRIISPAPTYATVEPPEPTPYFKMTMEEAHRILWPDATPPASPHEAGPSRQETRVSVVIARAEIEGVKFRVEGATKVEGKSLVMPGNKQLRVDFDQRLGLGD
ncbi:hypothetical protein GQ53DRAFT_845306, partial [Thozetella sp. PMI_491]